MHLNDTESGNRRQYLKLLLWLPLLLSAVALLIYTYPGLLLADDAYLAGPEGSLGANTLVLGRHATTAYITAGDTITYRAADDPEAPHYTREVADTRVVNGSKQFRPAGTGDWVEEENVSREVIWTIPVLGSLIAAVSTFPGTFVFIILPATLLVLSEVSLILDELGVEDDDRTTDG